MLIWSVWRQGFSEEVEKWRVRCGEQRSGDRWKLTQDDDSKERVRDCVNGKNDCVRL